jgi:ABC-type uncharacterized transport system substrate-binding protein
MVVSLNPATRAVPMKSMTLAGLATAVALALAVWFAPSTAQAHPHVWVVMKSELVYAPGGTITGVRHAWTFDDMFSTFATQGLEQKTKGVFTREELAPLAKVNIESLKEFDYFTYAKAGGKKLTFAAPKDYWLAFKDNTLILHFTLPLTAPVKANAVSLDIYDPSYYVDFAFAPKDAVTLAGAPADCKLTVAKPQEMTLERGNQLGDAFFKNPASSSNWGAQFANTVTVACP